MAKRGDGDLAHDALLRLSEFLRLTLEDAGRHEVPLQRECEVLRAYLAGGWADADDSATFAVTNPARGDTIAASTGSGAKDWRITISRDGGKTWSMRRWPGEIVATGELFQVFLQHVVDVGGFAHRCFLLRPQRWRARSGSPLAMDCTSRSAFPYRPATTSRPRSSARGAN